MAQKIAVIGIGKFGSHLCLALAEQGAEVMAIDKDPNHLDDVKDKVALTVRMDSTEEEALKAQGVEECDVVIVGIGDDFEATLLTIVALQSLGAKRIIARATTKTHERILKGLGIEEIVSPAVDAAERLAESLLYRGVVDSLELSDDYSIVEVTAPKSFVGKSVGELRLQEEFDVNLITIKRKEQAKNLFGLRSKTAEKILGVPKPELVVKEKDILVIFGKKRAINKVCDLE